MGTEVKFNDFEEEALELLFFAWMDWDYIVYWRNVGSVKYEPWVFSTLYELSKEYPQYVHYADHGGEDGAEYSFAAMPELIMYQNERMQRLGLSQDTSERSARHKRIHDALALSAVTSSCTQ